MLPYFLGKVKLAVDRDPKFYETHFEFTYTEANKFGCARRTFYNVLLQLVKKGFIDPVYKGGLRGGGLTSSKFKLSKRWKYYGTGSFVDVDFRNFGQKQVDTKMSRQHSLISSRR